METLISHSIKFSAIKFKRARTKIERELEVRKWINRKSDYSISMNDFKGVKTSCRKTFCRKTFWGKTSRRKIPSWKDISPKRYLAEKDLAQPKIHISENQTIDHSIIINHFRIDNDLMKYYLKMKNEEEKNNLTRKHKFNWIVSKLNG